MAVEVVVGAAWLSASGFKGRPAKASGAESLAKRDSNVE